MVQHTVSLKWAIGTTLWVMGGRGIPRHGRLVGYSFIEDESIVYSVQIDGVIWNEAINYYYETKEALLAKRAVISPAEAKKWLARHREKPIWWIRNKESEEFLEQRAALYNPRKATKKSNMLDATKAA